MGNLCVILINKPSVDINEFMNEEFAMQARETKSLGS